MSKRKINYPDNCQTLDVTKNIKIKQEGVKDIQFRFRSFPDDVSIYVILLGKSSACSRTLAELAFSQSGDWIKFGNLWEKWYAIKILGNKFVEEDPVNDCRIYPNNDFLSYKDCDDDFLRKEVDRISPGLQPIWLTHDLNLATPQKILTNIFGKVFFYHASIGFPSFLISLLSNSLEPILISHLIHAEHFPGYQKEMKHLYRGNKLSSCPMPCNTFRTTTRMISKRASDPLGRVLLSFSEKVTMTITQLETPSVSELLSAIGGSVGLWLGLGVFQAIEILSKVFFALADKVRIS